MRASTKVSLLVGAFTAVVMPVIYLFGGTLVLVVFAISFVAGFLSTSGLLALQWRIDASANTDFNNGYAAGLRDAQRHDSTKAQAGLGWEDDQSLVSGPQRQWCARALTLPNGNKALCVEPRGSEHDHSWPTQSAAPREEGSQARSS